MHKAAAAFVEGFLDGSPTWYKLTIVGFLLANPIILHHFGPFVTGWALMGEFIFTLAMALKCYPLPAGGLLAIEAIVLGLASPETVYHETAHNFPVIMLLMFMVAGIYFMQELLLVVFSHILVTVKSKVRLALLFTGVSAFLSAFLDALTVTAVIIMVAVGFYRVYHRFASRRGEHEAHDHTVDHDVHQDHHEELEQFRGFLRNLLMHGAVGTALGGVCTLVGEPQNLLIAHTMGWHFGEFFIRMAPISMPVIAIGLITCYQLEKKSWFGYGYQLPDQVREVMEGFAQRESEQRDGKAKARLVVQSIVAVYLILALALHLAEVGVIGLSVIILLTALNGVTEEHRIGHAFQEALPFTALLVVFFAIVAVIHEQHLFAPVIEVTLLASGKLQIIEFFIETGVLSMISDNVFVATVFITEAAQAFEAERITAEQFEIIAVAINTGTNIPSVATPNGQAAFLFLLTSSVAGLIRLSYIQMVKMAFPYTVTMTGTALLAVWILL
jgi:NhaB family Na+:H+ antiporter